MASVAIAYGALVLLSLAPNVVGVPVYSNMMAVTLLIIYIGSHKSVKNQQSGEMTETLQTRDAYMFPVIGSAVLFSLYLAYKFLKREYLDMVVSVYCTALGVLVLSGQVSYLIRSLTGLGSKSIIVLRKNKAVLLELNWGDIIALMLNTSFGVWYFTRKHWCANNIIGIAYSIQGIELMSIGSFFNGVILLSGLFFYDIFWVFGTDVMVTVAKSLDAPIKLWFPQPNELPPSMLGLGDIVIPGIFIALLLRADVKLNNPRQSLFWSNLLAYWAGLSSCVGIMYYFKAAQPALLYLVPACLGMAFLASAVNGQFSSLWAFSEMVEEEKKKKEEDSAVGPATSASAGVAQPVSGKNPKKSK